MITHLWCIPISGQFSFVWLALSLPSKIKLCCLDKHGHATQGVPILCYSYGPKREFIKLNSSLFSRIFRFDLFRGRRGHSYSWQRPRRNVRGQDHLAIRQRAEKMKAMKADRQWRADSSDSVVNKLQSEPIYIYIYIFIHTILQLGHIIFCLALADQWDGAQGATEIDAQSHFGPFWVCLRWWALQHDPNWKT